MASNAKNLLENTHINSSDFYLMGNIPEKKAINAIRAYGDRDDSPEDILVLFDATVFGSAKAGFYIAPFHFCYCDERGYKKIFDLQDIIAFDYEKATIMNYLIIEYTDDNGIEKRIKAEFNCYPNDLLEPLKEFLNELLEYLLLDFLEILEEEEKQEAKQEEAKRIEAQKEA